MSFFPYFENFSSFSVLLRLKFSNGCCFFLRLLRYSKIFHRYFSSLYAVIFLSCFWCVRSVRRNLMMFRLTYFVFKLSVNPEIWTAYSTVAVGQ